MKIVILNKIKLFTLGKYKYYLFIVYKKTIDIHITITKYEKIGHLFETLVTVILLVS